MLPFIPFRLVLGAVGALFIAYYAYQAGNQYGPSARAYKAVVAELNAKNKELEQAKKEDESDLPILDAARAAAAADASGLVTCKASKDAAKKINAVRE